MLLKSLSLAILLGFAAEAAYNPYAMERPEAPKPLDARQAKIFCSNLKKNVATMGHEICDDEKLAAKIAMNCLEKDIPAVCKEHLGSYSLRTK